MTEKELKVLPSFASVDGGRRYLVDDRDGDRFILDEYGRIVRYYCRYGDASLFIYDDKANTVTIVDIWRKTVRFIRRHMKCFPRSCSKTA